MGASESTERSNKEDEDEQKPPPQNNTGDGSGTGMAIAAAAAGAALVAWGAYKKISTNQETEGQENDDRMKMLCRSPGGPSSSYFLGSPTDQVKHQGKSTNPGAWIIKETGVITAWTPPPPGKYKLNTDGSCQSGLSGYGGILRDHQGNWIRGFRGYIGYGDILTAELQGILRGLEFLKRHGYEDSILESDSQQAINWINGDNSSYQKSNRNEEIIKSCRKLQQENNISFKWISTDYNKCADKLAKMGVKEGEPYVEILEIPDELKECIRSDQRYIAVSNGW